MATFSLSDIPPAGQGGVFSLDNIPEAQPAAADVGSQSSTASSPSQLDLITIPENPSTHLTISHEDILRIREKLIKQSGISPDMFSKQLGGDFTPIDRAKAEEDKKIGFVKNAIGHAVRAFYGIVPATGALFDLGNQLITGNQSVLGPSLKLTLEDLNPVNPEMDQSFVFSVAPSIAGTVASFLVPGRALASFGESLRLGEGAIRLSQGIEAAVQGAALESGGAKIEAQMSGVLDTKSIVKAMVAKGLIGATYALPVESLLEKFGAAKVLPALLSRIQLGETGSIPRVLVNSFQGATIFGLQNYAAVRGSEYVSNIYLDAKNKISLVPNKSDFGAALVGAVFSAAAEFNRGRSELGKKLDQAYFEAYKTHPEASKAADPPTVAPEPIKPNVVDDIEIAGTTKERATSPEKPAISPEEAKKLDDATMAVIDNTEDSVLPSDIVKKRVDILEEYNAAKAFRQTVKYFDNLTSVSSKYVAAGMGRLGDALAGHFSYVTSVMAEGYKHVKEVSKALKHDEAASNLLVFATADPSVVETIRHFKRLRDEGTLENSLVVYEGKQKRTFAKQREKVLKSLGQEGVDMMVPPNLLPSKFNLPIKNRADLEYYMNISDEKLSAIEDAQRAHEAFMKDFQERFGGEGIGVDFIKKRIEHLDDKINKAKKKGKKDKVKALKELKAQVKKLKFSHIPLEILMNDVIEKRSGTSTSGADRALAKILKKRKLNTLAQFFENTNLGIDPKDLRYSDIITSYTKAAGKALSLQHIVNLAKEYGLAVDAAAIKKEKGARAVYRALNYKSGAIVNRQYKGIKMHRALVETLKELIDIEDTTEIQRLLNRTKGYAFSSPFTLGAIDTVQAHAAGSFNLRTFTTPKGANRLIRAIRESNDMSEGFLEAWRHGAMSQTSAETYMSTQELGRALERNFAQSASHIMRKFASVDGINIFKRGNLIDIIYQPIHSTAWGLDRIIRYNTYLSLVDKGYIPEDAARITAMFHGRYGDVPNNLRRAMNYIFFTPTFKIAMARTQLGMLKAVTQKFDPRKYDRAIESKVLVRGLVNAVILHGAYHLFMTKMLGFDTVEAGRSYRRRMMITAPDGSQHEKDLIFTFNTPYNMFLKYLSRIHKAIAIPGNGTAAMKFLDATKYEFQVLWRLMYETANNRSRSGGPIYNFTDSTKVKAAKALYYMLANGISVINSTDNLLGNPVGKAVGLASNQSIREGRDAFEQMFPGYTKYIVSLGADLMSAFRYTRDPQERILRSRYKNVQQTILNEMRRMLKDGTPMSEENKKNAKEMLKLMKEYIEEADRRASDQKAQEQMSMFNVDNPATSLLKLNNDRGR